MRWFNRYISSKLKYAEPNVSTVIHNLNDIGIVEIIFYSYTAIFHSESAKLQTPVGYKLP